MTPADQIASLRAEVERLEQECAGLRRDGERLDWLERFLQIGNSCVFTTSASMSGGRRKDDTDETEWNQPFCIGYEVEHEHRGCYRWKELSNGAKGIRPAIDAAAARQGPPKAAT